MNEALNQIIWKKVPKDVYVEGNTLDIGVSSAIISFNDGCIGLLDVMTRCGLDPGFYAKKSFRESDIARVKSSNKKSSDTVKSTRKRLHADRKGYQDKNIEKEGETYAKGVF